MLGGDTWRVLVVDDQEATCRQITEHYEAWRYADNRLVVEAVTNFEAALKILEERRFDLVILDVYLGKAVVGGKEAGKDAFEAIKAERFVPIIFYTALPASVQDLAGPLVKVAEKGGEAFVSLDQKVKEYIDTPLLRINRALTRHIEDTVREYMWQFASKHWSELAGSADDVELAYLICRRLAASLDVTGAEKLAASLKGAAQPAARSADQPVHPLRFYLMPPPSDPTEYRCGDILRKSAEGDQFWLIMTPWCDLTLRSDNTRHAEHVLLVRCLLLKDFTEYAEWIGENLPSATKQERLSNLVGTPNKKPHRRQEGRYYFLPGVLDVPHLLVDFQQTRNEAYGEISGYQKIATLDSPYAESVVSWFVRFISRVGTPDLDVDRVIRSLQARAS